MLTNINLNPTQREFLLQWIDEQEGGITYQEVADRFGVHYQTARGWILILIEERLMKEAPFKKEGKKQFIRSLSPVETAVPVDRGPILVTRGKEHLTLMQWMVQNLNNTYLSRCAYAMVYLYVRSYFAYAPDQQHLRGTIAPVEVRAMILQWIDQVQKDLDVIKQTVQLRPPWTEGQELAERFGDLPVGGELTELIQMAQQFVRNVSPDAERSNEIPMPAPEVEPPKEMTLGDALLQGRPDEQARKELMDVGTITPERAREIIDAPPDPALGIAGLLQQHPHLEIVEDTDEP